MFRYVPITFLMFWSNFYIIKWINRAPTHYKRCWLQKMSCSANHAYKSMSKRSPKLPILHPNIRRSLFLVLGQPHQGRQRFWPGSLCKHCWWGTLLWFLGCWWAWLCAFQNSFGGCCAEVPPWPWWRTLVVEEWRFERCPGSRSCHRTTRGVLLLCVRSVPPWEVAKAASTAPHLRWNASRPVSLKRCFCIWCSALGVLNGNWGAIQTMLSIQALPCFPQLPCLLQICAFGPSCARRHGFVTHSLATNLHVNHIFHVVHATIVETTRHHGFIFRVVVHASPWGQHFFEQHFVFSPTPHGFSLA